MTDTPPHNHPASEADPHDAVLTDGLRLGTWGGVRISAHWSALIMVVLLATLLAESVLPTQRPHHTTTAYWTAGCLTALGFLLLLLAHELAHAVVARHFGLGVRSITLWMFGGVTDMVGEPKTARADAATAASGPATSLVLGAATVAVSSLLAPGLAATSVAWLGSMNILLGVFNLHPGAPLDGGRLLRALLWWRYRDRARAAAVAARAGRVLGFTLIALGALEFLAGQLIGLWLALIGWFIVTAAVGERAASGIAALRGIPARNIMTPISWSAPDWWTIDQLIAGLPAHATTQVVIPLLDVNRHTSGVVTLADLQAVSTDQRGERRLRDVAHRRRGSPLVIDAVADVGDLAGQLRAHGGVAVVVDGDDPVGVVTALEITRAARLGALGWQPTSAHRS